jgi:hypothetical protein
MCDRIYAAGAGEECAPARAADILARPFSFTVHCHGQYP